MPSEAPPVLGPHVERFRAVVSRQLGLAFEDAKLGLLGDVLRRRLDATDTDVEAFLAQCERAPSSVELGLLAQELTVPETYFFRNIEQFNALAEIVVPSCTIGKASRRSLRVLSAGCATGEEAYSLVMTIRDRLPDASWELAVRAVDVNPSVLQRARGGAFTTWALRETPAEAQRRWFRQNGRALILDESVRGAVQFEARNLAVEDPELWQPGSYDVVFCRNVIMYFRPDAAEALVARITRSLAPGGYLFLGHAETLRGLSHAYHLRHTHGTFYYQRKDEVGREGASAVAPGSNRAEPPPPASVVEVAGSWIEAIQRASDRISALALASGSSRERLNASERADLTQAFELLGRERFSEALAAVRSLPPESQRDTDVLMLEAVLLVHDGQLAAARAACQRLLSIDELNAGAHYVLALCGEVEADRQSAADHDQVAIYLDPTFAMPRLHLGLLARRAGDRAGARRELGQAQLLLQREDPSRLLLFGGGFGRAALTALCAAELEAVGA